MLRKLIIGRLENIVIGAVSAVLLITNVSPVNPQKTPIDLNNYSLVFSDEFDGNEVDWNKWAVHNSSGIRKGGYWSDEQCKVENGNLVITTEYKEDGRFGKGWYTGSLSNQKSHTQTYGYYECRCILPKGQGLWSAFWLTCKGTSTVNGNGKDGTEIDVFESPYYFLNGKNAWKVTSNLHYDGYGIETKYKNVVISALDNNPYENYNTYGVLWTENEYVYYVNGKEVARSNYGGVSQVPEYAILSCEVDGAAGTPSLGWSGDIRLNKEGKNFTASFIVDYVRIYQ